MKRATIRIKNLALRAIIGFNEWEREKKQDLLINIEVEFDAQLAVKSDKEEDTVDYKKITKRVIDGVEKSSYRLLETLAHRVLEIVMEDPGVLRATVEVDKPHSLRFAESVSVVVRSVERNA
ncbi:MAG TPA: dihydroneopterin aldolase [Candidatus Glassbacteria bacterium]|nr:dihydroneopterin aldolase [Candidatus Glassbacteria bacterium]